MELLPCPFCGSNNIKLHQQHWHMSRKAQCIDCHSESTYDEQEGIKTWNTRHSSWISVKDKEIPSDIEVLISNGYKTDLPIIDSDGKGFLIDDMWWSLEEYKPTHWMPLPSLPDNK